MPAGTTGILKRMSIDRAENSTEPHSDEDLVLLARAGDRSAFGELWQRHSRSGLRVARQFTSSIDADDLVSEAYARIYQRVLAGGGPDGAFRPYLYTTIRNLASRWGQSRRDVNVDDMGEFEDPSLTDDPATIALDRTLTVRAFRALPERWQSVLWYTEVEGMDPHEVAPILGISANGVAALAYRAREGLRKAWLQAHVSDATASGECQWSIARLGDFARDGLTARDRTRVSDHLATCTKCSIINEEVDEVGSRLALVMLPLLLGGIAGGTLLASFGASGSAMAASAAAPVMPPAFGTLGSVGVVAAPAVTSGLTAAAMSAPLVGALTVALVLSGGLAVGSTAVPPTPPALASAATSAANSAATSASGPFGSGSPTAWRAGPDAGSLDIPPLSLRRVDATAVGILDPLGSVLGSTLDSAGGVLAPATAPLGSALNGAAAGAGKAVSGLVNDVTNPINALIPGAAVRPGTPPARTAPGGVVGATIALDLSGSGIPGATVSLQSAGAVYATTKITPQGTWAIHLSALPAATTGLQLKQTVLSVLGIDLGIPLRVLSNSLGVGIDVLGQ